MNQWNNDILSGYVDNQTLSEAEKQVISLELLDTSLASLLTIQVVQATKARVNKLQNNMVDVPIELKSSILNAINHERIQEKNKVVFSPPSLFDKFAQYITIFLRKPQYAISAFVLIVIGGYFFASNFQQSSVGGDFHAESFQNFNGLVSGKLLLQKTTSSVTDLEQYFHDNGVDYTIIRPSLDAKLIGGVITNMNGRKLAHLVYKHNEKYIYIYEAPEDLFQRHVMQIPNRVVEYADSGKWYSESEADRTWMFWREKTTYCSVVSDIPKNELFSLFIKGV